MEQLCARGFREGGPGGRGPVPGTPKEMLSKSLEWASVPIGAPILGQHERTLFS